MGVLELENGRWKFLVFQRKEVVLFRRAGDWVRTLALLRGEVGLCWACPEEEVGCLQCSWA